MSNQLDLFEQLAAPFPANDIEWRVQQSGVKNGRVWAMVIPYITNRAIQSRLDAVFGPTGWKNEYKTDQISGGVLCGISVWCSDKKEWVTKWDGVKIEQNQHNKDIDPIKTAMSNSMKRAAVHWGIGRYLYNMDAMFADCFQDRSGKNRGKARDKNGGPDVYFTWNPPVMPMNAQPKVENKKPESESFHGKHKTRSDAKTALFRQQRERERTARQQRQNNTDPDKAAVNIVQKSITPAQVQAIRNVLQEKCIPENDLLNKLGMNQIGNLDASRFDGCIAWLSNLTPRIDPDEQKLNDFIDSAQVVTARYNHINLQKDYHQPEQQQTRRVPDVYRPEGYRDRREHDLQMWAAMSEHDAQQRRAA